MNNNRVYGRVRHVSEWIPTEWMNKWIEWRIVEDSSGSATKIRADVLLLCVDENIHHRFESKIQIWIVRLWIRSGRDREREKIKTNINTIHDPRSGSDMTRDERIVVSDAYARTAHEEMPRTNLTKLQCVAHAAM